MIDSVAYMVFGNDIVLWLTRFLSGMVDYDLKWFHKYLIERQTVLTIIYLFVAQFVRC